MGDVRVVLILTLVVTYCSSDCGGYKGGDDNDNDCNSDRVDQFSELVRARIDEGGEIAPHRSPSLSPSQPSLSPSCSSPAPAPAFSPAPAPVPTPACGRRAQMGATRRGQAGAVATGLNWADL